MARKPLSFARAAAVGLLALAALAAFVAYRDPDLMLALLSAWKLCV